MMLMLAWDNKGHVYDPPPLSIRNDGLSVGDRVVVENKRNYREGPILGQVVGVGQTWYDVQVGTHTVKRDNRQVKPCHLRLINGPAEAGEEDSQGVRYLRMMLRCSEKRKLKSDV